MTAFKHDQVMLESLFLDKKTFGKSVLLLVLLKIKIFATK
jgi:hypothetical protein